MKEKSDEIKYLVSVIEVYIPAASKVILRRVSACRSGCSLWLYSDAPLGYNIITQYRRVTQFAATEPNSHVKSIIMYGIRHHKKSCLTLRGVWHVN